MEEEKTKETFAKEEEKAKEEEAKKKELEKRQFLKKNFFFVNKAEFPSWWAKYIQLAYFSVGFAVFFIAYFNTVLVTILVSSASMLIGIWAMYKWLTPYLEKKNKFSERPSENQMESWLIQEIKKDVKPKAIEKLSLHRDKIKLDNFIILPYPIYWHTGGIEDEHIVRLKSEEGHFIYASYKIQVLAITENYVSLYTCKYDWLNNQVISEDTNEFFFDDISSIKNGKENLTTKRIDYEEPKEEEESEDSGEIGSAKIFSIKNMSGEALSVITEIVSLETSPRVVQKLDNLIKVLRITLRNRRYGETFEKEEKE